MANKSILIFGKGFGLYGYLPAVINLKIYDQINLNSRYIEFLSSRNELKEFIKYCNFYEDEDKALNESNDLILARTPVENNIILKKIKDRKDLIIMEKPISANSKLANNIFEILITKARKYFVNYIFLNTNWYKTFKNYIFSSKDNNFYIEWNFNSNSRIKSPKSWKKNSLEGGGIVNYYGIHLIALAASLDFVYLEHSEIKDNYIWESTLTRKDHKRLSIKININKSYESFNISGSNKIIKKLSTPFSEELTDFNLRNQDIRSSLIYKILNSNKLKNNYELNIKTINLWNIIEKMNLRIS